MYVNEYVLPTTPGHLFADTPGAAAGAPGTNEPDEAADRILLCWFCLFGTDAKRRNDRGAPFPPIPNDNVDVEGRKIPLVALVKAPRIAMVGWLAVDGWCKMKIAKLEEPAIILWSSESSEA